MVPDSVSRQSLRFLFAEHFFVPLVFGGDPSDRACRDCFRVEDDPSDEVIVCSSSPRDISLSRYKDRPFCVISTQDYWELGVVDPSPFPIYLGLGCSKPWITEDCFLFPEFCEIEPKIGVIGPCLNLKVSVEAEFSTFTLTFRFKQIGR